MKKKDFNFLVILAVALCIIATGIARIRKRGK